MKSNDEMEIMKKLYYNEVYSSYIPSSSPCPEDIIKESRNNVKDELVLCTNKKDLPYIKFALFTELSILLDNDTITIENRKDVEFHSDKIQLVCAAFIHNDQEVILLKTKKESVTYPEGSYTLIQGHINLIDISMNLHDTIIANIKREISEEIQLVQDIEIISGTDIQPVYSTTTACNRNHYGFIVHINIHSSYVQSNEPEKHDAMFIHKDELYTHFRKLCPWVVYCLSEYSFFRR